MINNDFVTVGYVLEDVLSMVGDTDLQKGLSRGWYVSRIHLAIQELALDTFYQKCTLDILDWNDGSNKFEIPDNVFNLREVYLWNSNSENAFDYSTDVKTVHFKRRHNSSGGSGKRTARIRTGSTDSVTGGSFYSYGKGTNTSSNTSIVGELYYAGLQDGIIDFGVGALNFSNLRLVFNGMGGKVGENPAIPRLFFEAVSHFVQEKSMRSFKNRGLASRQDWKDAHDMLHAPKSMTTPSVWDNAKRRAKTSDTWIKDSINEYQSSYQV